MALTNTQYQTLSTNIAATPALDVFVSTGNDGAISSYYNELTATDAWRESVSPAEADDAPDYSAYDTLAAGKRDSWRLFLGFSRDYTRNKVRKWITDIWGPATAGTNAELILQASLEKATRAQVLFGGSTKTTGTVSALDRTWSELLTANDVSKALRG